MHIGPGQTWSLSWEACVFIEGTMLKYLGWYWFVKCFMENKTPWGSDNCAWEDGVTQERINVWHEQNLSWDLKPENT